MELRHLRYFAAVAETLNFSRAAARLHLTQPALSRQIRDLEEELGCRLLLRGQNARTELTPEGRRLLAGAQKLLAEADRLAAAVRTAGTRLRLGHYGSLWLDHFTPALRTFARKNPAVPLEPVELTPGTLPAALRRGEVDVALVGPADAGLRREFEVRHLTAVPAQLVLPTDHPLAKRRQLRLEALREDDWVVWDEKEFPGRRHLLMEACRLAGFRPRIVQTTDSMASMLVHVATARQVGYMLPMAARYPHPGVVFTRTVPREAILFTMHAAWPKSSPRASLIAALVRELLAGVPRCG